MDMREACESLLAICRYAEDGRLNESDLERAEEMWRTIRNLGPFFLENLRKQYVESGVRVRVGQPVAVEDDNGCVVVKPFLGLESSKFQVREEP